LKKQKRPKKIGLALGSGSARGWAHIGVIEALADAGITVDYVAGTSAGAVVGAVYAAGNINSLKDSALRMDWKRVIYFLDVVFPKSGLIDGNRIAEFIKSHVQEKDIENLPIPFRAVSTDLTTGNEIAIHKGDIIEAVRASISIPGIFTPVKKDDMTLVDGGLVNPVPVSVVREMGADFVIAIDLNHDILARRGLKKPPSPKPENMEPEINEIEIPTGINKVLGVLNKKSKAVDIPALTHVKQWMAGGQKPTIFEVLVTSITIMEEQITSARLKTDPPDLLIQPRLGHMKLLEFYRAKEAILEGYNETKRCIQKLGI